MLFAKFSKTGAFAFVSYLDCRDVIVQSIRRAGIKVGYSQGFNPHELIYFSPPTSLGVQSYCEYMYIITDECVDEFKEKFNAKSPVGLKIDYALKIDKKPDFYNLIDVAEYRLTLDKEIDLNNFSLDYVNQKNEIEDLSDKVLKIEKQANELKLIAYCGQKSNLKISKFLECIEKTNAKVVQLEKIALFKIQDDQLKSIDELINF